MKRLLLSVASASLLAVSAVATAAEARLGELSPQRRAYAAEVLSSRGGVLVTESLDESCRFADSFAAEHVALMVEDAWEVAQRLRNAGEILIGCYPIFSLANYAMGINAILPTGGLAKVHSGISVRDFVKRTSIGYVNREGFERLRAVVPALSRNEGFSAHHEAVLRWLAPTASFPVEVDPS